MFYVTDFTNSLKTQLIAELLFINNLQLNFFISTFDGGSVQN